jgi:hypothetical protein
MVEQYPSRCNLTTTDNTSAWVARWLRPSSPQGKLLDWAAGSLRHSLFAAGLGYQVTAIDKLPQNTLPPLPSELKEKIGYRCCDLESGSWPLSALEQFDVILVTNYLFRQRLPLLGTHLASDGVFIYETFAVGNAEFGRPKNPDFLLKPGELLDFCRRQGWHVLAYEDGITSTVNETNPSSTQKARVQRVVAHRRINELSHTNILI